MSNLLLWSIKIDDFGAHSSAPFLVIEEGFYMIWYSDEDVCLSRPSLVVIKIEISSIAYFYICQVGRILFWMCKLVEIDNCVGNCGNVSEYIE